MGLSTIGVAAGVVVAGVALEWILWLRFLNDPDPTSDDADADAPPEPALVVDDDFIARRVFRCFTLAVVVIGLSDKTGDWLLDDEPSDDPVSIPIDVSFEFELFEDEFILRLNSRCAKLPIRVVLLLLFALDVVV